mmetsp:Transcript_72806/g.230030  ORF Transcript_72806/g.230030 Transcript_72806/m.230030 type:complete len:391 (+) Transcript_72806:52-1224(+)
MWPQQPAGVAAASEEDNCSSILNFLAGNCGIPPRRTSLRSSGSQVDEHAKQRLHRVARLVGGVQQLQNQGAKTFPAEIWKQVLVLLLEQLSSMRQGASIEDVLPDHILQHLLEVLPRALPDLETFFTALSVPEVLANLLQLPGLRERIDQRILCRLPVPQMDEQAEDPGFPETDEVLVDLSTIVLQAVISKALSAPASSSSAAAAPPLPASLALSAPAGRAPGGAAAQVPTEPGMLHPSPGQMGIQGTEALTLGLQSPQQSSSQWLQQLQQQQRQQQQQQQQLLLQQHLQQHQWQIQQLPQQQELQQLQQQQQSQQQELQLQQQTVMLQAFRNSCRSASSNCEGGSSVGDLADVQSNSSFTAGGAGAHPEPGRPAALPAPRACRPTRIGA